MTTYGDAGVDLNGARRYVEDIAATVTATWSDRVIGLFGGFAAGIELAEEYERPVLMMTTDGVGTKLDIARRCGIWDGVGFDLVAMCVDDLAAVGARPLGLVDYLAVGSLVAERDKAIVASIAAACTAAGCALLGGETAEHPGVMAADAVDLAGAALGVVEKGKDLGPHLVTEDDLVIGLRSPNLRSNGFSLVRAALEDDLENHGTTLLEPSVIYSPSVLRALAGGGVHAGAHITGGGIAANLARVLPRGLGVVVDTQTWTSPAVFDLIASRGVSEEEMFRTFNMGIGFCLVVEPTVEEDVIAALAEHDPVTVGRITTGDEVTLQ